MLQGIPAFWLTAVTGLIVAIISAYALRFGALMTRRSEVDKIYMARIKDLEGANKSLTDQLEDERKEHREELEDMHKQVYDLREKAIHHLGQDKYIEQLEERLIVKMRLLRLHLPREVLLIEGIIEDDDDNDGKNIIE